MPKKIRYAVVGLGHIAQIAMLPAFGHAKKNSELVAIVTGDPVKAKKISKQYRVPIVCGYEDYTRLLASGEIDAVYVSLPNHLHYDFVMAALSAGVHVLCEKPLSLNLDDADLMRRTAHHSNAKLMTAYRLHFEASNLKALELCRSGEIGKIKYFNSNFSFVIHDPNNIRVKSETGGGPVWDIGIYCINAVRNLFQSEPLEVFAFAANQGQELFNEVEESVSVTLRFPQERIASFICSFGADKVSEFKVVGSKGSVHLENVYEYASPRTLTVRHDENTRVYKYKKCDQFGPELVYFSNCILHDRIPEPSALEAMADVRVILAIYESMRSGLPVRLPEADLKQKRPNKKMRKVYPGIQAPKGIHVRSPSS